jgi:hypothetical protein
VQALADVFGERDGFGVTKNLDGLAAGIDNDAAVGATGKVLLKVGTHVGVEDAVEITRQL